MALTRFIPFLSLLFLFQLGSVAWAANDDEDTPEAEGAVEEPSPSKEAVAEEPKWKQRRRQLREKIEERLHREHSERRVAQTLNFGYPVRKPTMTRKEVKADIQRRVDAALDEEYPLSRVEKFREEAKETFDRWRVGDEITIQVGGPRPRKVTGEIKRIHPEFVRIGYDRIATLDLDPETRAHFFPEQLEEKRRQYVRQRLNDLRVKRELHEDKIEPAITREVYRKAGYVFVKGKWYPKAFVLDKVLQARRKRAFPEVEKEVMTSHGFKQYEDEWMPKDRAAYRKAMDEARGTADTEAAVSILNEVLQAYPSSTMANEARELKQRLRQTASQETQDAGAEEGAAAGGDGDFSLPMGADVPAEQWQGIPQGGPLRVKNTLVKKVPGSQPDAPPKYRYFFEVRDITGMGFDDEFTIRVSNNRGKSETGTYRLDLRGEHKSDTVSLVTATPPWKVDKKHGLRRYSYRLDKEVFGGGRITGTYRE